MLNAFALTPQGLRHLDPSSGIPEEALWVDMVEPTSAEEALVERTYAIEVPTREEMREIEASSRLYEEDGALYMTITIITKLDTESPENSQITFILAKNRLITNRYVDPLPFQRFIAFAEKHPSTCSSAPILLAGLIEAIVNRMADVLERVGADLDQLSVEVFTTSSDGRRSITSGNRNSRTYLARVGQNGDLTSKARESLVSLGRLLAFAQQSPAVPNQIDVRGRLTTLARDVQALTDHASYLANKASFLLEATLGLINLEQNNIIKIFSVVAVMFMPPTLIASIYGMNFRDMPELAWPFGYPMALALMFGSILGIYFYFKRRGWL